MIVTPAEAAKKACCVDLDRTCQSTDCMAWRWQPLMTDDAWREAVKKAAADIGDTSPSRAKAAAHVNANRADYGLPTRPFRGYCGRAIEVES